MFRFTAVASFSKARASIWRTRSRLTPKLGERFLQRQGLIHQLPGLDDAAFAGVETAKGLHQCLMPRLSFSSVSATMNS